MNYDFLKEWSGKVVEFCQPAGNAGDDLINAATRQLFKQYQIRVGKSETVLYAGGGNMGVLYPQPFRKRQELLRQGKRIVILPQSFTSPEPLFGYEKIFVRERHSLQLCAKGILAPDLALGMKIDFRIPKASIGLGVFMRRDIEACGSDVGIDPALECETYVEYVQLAAKYKIIKTNRLHFAIAGLLLGRHVVLLPNSYHKNKSMYDTWLKDMGCNWSDSL